MRLCFDAHRADGKVWCVQTARWLSAREVVIRVPMRTVYKASGKQPKAWLEPTVPARAVRRGHTLVIEAR